MEKGSMLLFQSKLSCQGMTISTADTDLQQPLIHGENGMLNLNSQNDQSLQEVESHEALRSYLRNSNYFPELISDENRLYGNSDARTAPFSSNPNTMKNGDRLSPLVDTSAMHPFSQENYKQKHAFWGGINLLSDAENPKASPSNFILFDQDGSTRRIIVPRQIPLLPNSYVSTSKLNEELVFHKKEMSSRMLTELLFNNKGFNSLAESKIAGPDLHLPFADLEKAELVFGSSEPVLDVGSLHAKFETQASLPKKFLAAESEPSEEFYTITHENTEDIEALLSSDEEEVSTGRSPSIVTEVKEDVSAEDDMSDVTSGILVKKRKNDDVDSIELDLRLRPFKTEYISPIVKASRVSNVFNDPNIDHMKWQNQDHGLSNNLFTKKSRKERIKSTVDVLKTIIPGGDCMDTSILLDEAIQHVKTLQQRVKLLETEVR